ncbi:MAG: thiopurine S-methyltransferase [Hyphomicrobiaceae bacterium]|nr:thiopurine S-methyltransferase [Hyphomicrobiaceae bacterium]
MEPDFWIERWQRGETGFHQEAGNDLLAKHWPALGLAPGSTVFVPLCGKSVDMVRLAAQGHSVIGAELSPLAVQDFFSENALHAEIRKVGSFTVHTAGAISIWCGDFFALPFEATQDAAAVYDRAALIALPADMQVKYADKLRSLLPAGTPILLVSLTYPHGAIEGPPFATSRDQVDALFSATHDITILEERDGLETSPVLKQRGVSQLDEVVYVLRPRADAGMHD